MKHDLVRGLKDITFEKDKLCSACQAKKQVDNTHPKKSIMSTSKAFELVHIDLFGPTTYTSIGGDKYGFMIVDDFTRYTWVFFLVDKSDVFATFKSFVKGDPCLKEGTHSMYCAIGRWGPMFGRSDRCVRSS